MVDAEEHGAGGRHALAVARVHRLEEEPDPEPDDRPDGRVEAVHVGPAAHVECRACWRSSPSASTPTPASSAAGATSPHASWWAWATPSGSGPPKSARSWNPQAVSV